jgi:metabotropic X receptor
VVLIASEPGVLGAASSVTSIQVANLLRLFKIPQVSFFSTSPELSNKDRFEYFLRTVPSDTNQVKAMVEIVKLFNWTYVSVIYEESNYGDKVSSETHDTMLWRRINFNYNLIYDAFQAFAVMEVEFSKNKICIAIKEKLTKDSGVAGSGYYEQIVRRLLTKPNARGEVKSDPHS